MLILLMFFYNQASKKVTEFSRKLQNSLALCGLQEKDLPITLKHLQESALDKKSKWTYET